MKTKHVVTMSLLIIGLSPVYAGLWLPSIFSSGMVLQSGQPVPVWGEADPGAEVTVEFAGQTKNTIADSSNHWEVLLDPMPVSSELRTLIVSCGSGASVLQYSGVQVGEVGLLAGQSNMELASENWTEYVGLKPGNNGNLYAATNWIGDVLPTGGNGLTGWVTGEEMPAGKTFWMLGVIYDFALLQKGGRYVQNGDLNLRGGVTNATVAIPGRTVWEINDAASDSAVYTNFYVTNNLVIWSHMGGEIELTLTAGRIEVGGTFKMNAAGKGILNIKNGVFRAQHFLSSGGILNMLSGGTAEVFLGQLTNADRKVAFNFETGNKGSVTIYQTETGASFSTNDWRSLAAAGELTVDGKAAGLEYFVLSNGGNTIQHIGALPGLSVINGKLYKDGAVYRGIGVNYCDLFWAMISFPEYAGQTEYRTLEGIRFLGEQKIPFVRFGACGFWPTDWNLYFQNKEEWFHRLDLIVSAAEEAGVGLIPDLFWRSETFPNLTGEYRDQWANPASQVRQFMTTYVQEFVGRYKNSPAIWGWEFSNEFNNKCDLPNWQTGLGTAIPSVGVGGISIEVNERNKSTYEIGMTAFDAFAAEVRKYDTHRFISSGNSQPRPSSWHNQMETNWVVDTYSQAREAFSWMAPTSSISMASFHVYPYSMSDPGVEPAYAGTTGVSNILLRYREFCDNQKQVMFVGEYSSFYNAQGPMPEDERASETALLDAIVNSGADLAAYWVFDRGLPWVRTEVGTIRATNEYRGVLDLILEYDAKMRGEIFRPPCSVPREWFSRFGIAPSNWQTWTAVESQDLNGNGMPVWQEYYAGINPTNAGSVFAITGFHLLPDNALSLEWLGGTNGVMTPYMIQCATNLSVSGGWQTIGSKTRQEGINSWSGNVFGAESVRYFRILAVPE